MIELRRIVLTELLERPDTTSEIAQACAIDEGQVLIQLRDLNERIKELFRFRDDPITTTRGGGWKADGIAGLIRLNATIELEIVPKFLDADNPSWRQDFFLLAVLVQTGHLLRHDEIAADVADRGDLATIIAWSFLALCQENVRRPIRGYKRAHARDFAIDGDVEPETILLPDADGFAVTRLELTRRNPYNATILAAAQILEREVTDADTQTRLKQLARSMQPQELPPRVPRQLPQRHTGWAGAYDLAKLVVEGLGLNLDEGKFSGPGFILSTWQAWQHLCHEIVRRALPENRVLAQQPFGFGARGSEPVWATPDISAMRGDTPQLLLDAKYKTRIGRKSAISASDTYESFAFLHASKTKRIELLYPAIQSVTNLALGEWAQFDIVDVVGGFEVRGVEVQIQGIAQRGGFERVVAGARSALMARFNHIAGAVD